MVTPEPLWQRALRSRQNRVVWKRRGKYNAHAWIDGKCHCWHATCPLPRIKPREGATAPPEWTRVPPEGMSAHGIPYGPVCAFCAREVRAVA